VLDADAIVHALYDTEAVKTALHLRWGDGVFDGEEIDRAAVARLIFKSADQRAWLEGLLWPLTGQRQRAFREELEARSPRPRAGIVEVALLFEADAAARFDATIAIVADDRLRMERLALRDQAELAARDGRQLAQAEKAARATYTVVNEGTEQELEQKLAAILDTLAP
jgi:dephospho-CoA kinase